jgi:hypothetical protein
MSVAPELESQPISCPHYLHTFVFTSPEQVAGRAENRPPSLPEYLPFLKSNRRRLLEDQIKHLAADGELSPDDERQLVYLAAHFGLDEKELRQSLSNAFVEELKPIRQRINETAYVTDTDLEQLEALKKRYKARIELEPEVLMCRERFLLDERDELPTPVPNPAIMLNAHEIAYLRMRCAWGHVRKVRHGYVGGSTRFRIAKGISFSVGRAVPISRDELVTLGEGFLYATNRRVLFTGAGQNTSILLSRISEIEVFRDAVCFGKGNPPEPAQC